MKQVCIHCNHEYIGKNSSFCSTNCYKEHNNNSKEIKKNVTTYANIQAICKDILKIDSKIRFVGIWYHSEITWEYKEGLATLLNDNEINRNVRETVIRQSTRNNMGKKVGAPEFSLTKYGTIYRITIPFTKDDWIQVHTSTDCDVLGVVDKIQTMKNNLDLDSLD